jgi:deazaflavin-dependent oxidoreductase (nitroreductase family)
MAFSTVNQETQYLYLTTIGRITGEPREIEIWFVESEGKLYILAEHFHEAQWVKNIEHNSRVRVRLGKAQFDGAARVLDQKRDRAAWDTAQRLAIEKYGWGEGLPVEIVRREE